MRRVTFYRSKPGHHRPHGPLVTPVAGGFPHIWEYYGCSSAGDPVVVSTGVFDDALVAKLAKHDLVTLNTAPFINKGTPNNLGIFAALRALNPDIIILLYEQMTNKFQNLSPGTVVTGDEWSLARGIAPYAGTDRTLYYDSTHPNPPGGNSFPADDNGLNGTYTDVGPIASQLLSVLSDYTRGAGADGMFFDYCQSVVSFPAGVNYSLAGYASEADLETSIANGISTITAGLLQNGYVYGNRGDANLLSDAIAHTFTGELLEHWDHGNASAPSSFASMDAAMAKATFWQGPTATSNGTILLKAEEESITFAGDYDSTQWRRAMRKTAASAAIAGGYSYVSNNRNAHELDTLRWADEYWVTPNGVADSNASDFANSGWLGRPTEYGYKDSTSGLWVRHFDNGVVLMNGTSGSLSITLERQYKRILGTHDPVVNDGSTVQTVSVPAGDGRFLLKL